jgi:arsenite methyltransferase
MAVTCPVDLDTARLREEVRSIYSRVAASPDGDFHFHRGAEYAATFLQYDREALAALPPFAVASFAGVGNPLRIEPVQAGSTVIDIGSGAGTDLLLAAKAVGPRGRAIGVDMTDSMISKAEAAAAAAGLANVEIRRGDALELPVENGAADVVISNGVLNLAPDKRRAFSEVLRVLRPGGRFLYADIVVASELPESIRRDIDLWSG